eukprot:m.316337 g.316337  ORF g.316337 m.316337 type:complete len:100 (+) comp16502_c0_seq13:217-516(+)
MTISNNNLLSKISFPSLAVVIGALRIQNSNQLDNINLNTLNDAFSITMTYVNDLTTLSLPNLAQMRSGPFQVQRSTNLQRISAPKLLCAQSACQGSCQS